MLSSTPNQTQPLRMVARSFMTVLLYSAVLHAVQDFIQCSEMPGAIL